MNKLIPAIGALSVGAALITSGGDTVNASSHREAPSIAEDQYVDNIAISSTTLTVTLAANATANNTFVVTVLEP